MKTPHEIKPKVVVIGSCIIDITIVTESIPRIGESIVASEIFTQVGGKASNQAIAISRLGGYAYLLAKIGRDPWASIALKTWNDEKVDISCVVQEYLANTGMGIVTIDGHGRNFTLSTLGANQLLRIEDVETIMEKAQEAKVLSIHLNASHDVIYSALYEAKAQGMITVLNGSPPADIPAEFYKLIDIFVVNNIEASFYSGTNVINYDYGVRAGMQILNRGVAKAIITLGADGLALVSHSEQHHMPAYKVHAIDTTGAGDVFIAGLVIALAENQDFLSAARFGCAASALSVTKLGVLDSIPFRENVNRFIVKNA